MPDTKISDLTDGGAPQNADELPARRGAGNVKLAWSSMVTALSSLFASAAQGTDSREWTAATVDQTEAETGTATTRRAWTAQRVAQAISAQVTAWWTALTVSPSKVTMATARLLGRTTAGSGGAEEISIGSGLSLSSGTLSATGSGFGGGWSLDTGTGVLTANGRTELLLANSGAGQQTLWKTVSQLYPGAVGYSMQFSEGTFPVPFTYVDRVMNFGFNWTGTAPVDSAQAAMFFQFESCYQLNNDPAPEMKVTEWHLNHKPVGGGVMRPFSMVCAWDGGFSNVGMSGSMLQITDLAANERLVGLYLNGQTTLAAGITSSATTITLRHARAIANGQNITILAEGANTTETVTVTAGGGTTTLTVTRGVAGTTASAHGIDAQVMLPAATLTARSTLIVASDANTPVSVTNTAGTQTLFSLSWGSATVSTPVAVSAGVQNLLNLTNTNVGGTATLRLLASNGAKVGTWSLDSGGNLVFSANGTGGGMFFDYPTGGATWRTNAFGTAMSLSNAGQLGVGLGSFASSALVHIKAGTATAGTAPLKLTAGTNLTTPENGAFEFDGTNLYFTVGGVRKTVTLV